KDGSQLYRKDGAAAGDLLGSGVSSAGDINQDGYDDFIVGAYRASPGGKSQAGSAYIYSGIDGSIIYQKDGENAGDNFGVSSSSLGDINSDGIPDFIVAAYWSDPGGISNAGSAYVYSGADGSLIYQKDGTVENQYLGNKVSSAGDVNGDGTPDFFVGSYGTNNYNGEIYLYSGSDGSLLWSYVGKKAMEPVHKVRGVGDINNDGKPDFIIGAPRINSWQGEVYVYVSE
ncbi:MAG: FG-GAP repeat protein, partial [Candidatus Saganbacteria bacterium]|nr:FG-GAP repeat protein [Candidatus Saganbacteria bacterium]